MARFSVPYIKSSTVYDRYRITVEAESAEAAGERVIAAFAGETDLSFEEWESEFHSKELDGDQSTFESLCDPAFDPITEEPD